MNIFNSDCEYRKQIIILISNKRKKDIRFLVLVFYLYLKWGLYIMK